nr:glycosyltransferase [Oenococcus oeni]
MINELDFFQKKNGGLSSARNYGLPISRGEWIYFIDPDDVIKKDLLEKCMLAQKEDNSDLVMFRFHNIDDSGKRISHDVFSDKMVSGSYSREDLFSHYLLGHFQNYVWCYIARKNVYVKNKIFFPIGKKYEDIYTTPKVINGIAKATFLDEYLYFYRLRNGSITKTPSKERTTELFDAFLYSSNFLHDILKNKFKKSQHTYLVDALLHVYTVNLYRKSSDSKKIEKQLTKLIRKNLWQGRAYGLSWKKKILSGLISFKLIPLANLIIYIWESSIKD